MLRTCQNVLVALDGSEQSEKAFWEAVDICKTKQKPNCMSFQSLTMQSFQRVLILFQSYLNRKRRGLKPRC